jgi:hypothetical protein
MLYRVATLVGGNGSRGNAAAVKNILAQVNGFGFGVIMIGKLAFNAYYLYIKYAVGAQHFNRYLLARQAG